MRVKEHLGTDLIGGRRTSSRWAVLIARIYDVLPLASLHVCRVARMVTPYRSFRICTVQPTGRGMR